MLDRLRIIGLAAALAAASPASSTETIQDCAATKARWTRALRSIDPARPDLVFARSPGGQDEERVSNLSDVDARITCLESAVNRVELRELAAPEAGAGLKAFLVTVVSVLVAFDTELTPNQAADLVAALRAEASPSRDALSNWGPYRITYSARGQGGRAAFVIDLAEN